ncbi:MAG: hypothetical protein JW958_05195 [Candidatus Eisenbacteria bacterium]|nr:hypothetical protein [Candidatus Eisenbacteria bacterium]
MKGPKALAPIALALCLAAPALGLQPPDTIPVDGIRRGQTGFGLTVLEGTRIDTFRVEVLDVMRGAGGSGDIILVLVSGLGLEEGGVAQGMSGSPVFLGGRLAGAVAYSYPYSTKPIAGVTPIGEMWEVLERDLLEEKEAASSAGGSPPGAPGLARGPDPIATPLSFAGFAPEVARRMEEFFLPYGMVATAAGAAGGNAEESGEWKPLPGAAVGVSLLSGDASLSAIGTLTWIDGDRLVAFGHPLFQAGSVRMPLVSASIHTVVPSRFVSFKLGSPIRTVGALTQDRRPGVAAGIGAKAPTVPIDVEIVVPGVGEERYHYEAIREKRITPNLVAWSVMNSILYKERAMGEGYLKVTLDIELDGAPPLNRKNVFSGYTALQELNDEILFPLQVLANNPLESPAIRSVRVRVEAREARSSARIEEVRLEKARVRPGGRVRGSITLRLFQGGTVRRDFDLPVPANQPEGKMQLRVCDALAADDFDLKRAPYRYATDRIEGLVGYLERLRTNENVYCTLYDASSGATVSGREMPRLPRSVLTVIKEPLHTGDADEMRGRIVAERTVTTDAHVTGCKTLPITVDRAAP